MKRVVAVSGATVCANGSGVVADRSIRVGRRRADAAGRPLPWWQGCRTLSRGELFLLMTDAPDSFDGRYFGVTASTDVIGKAVLLWQR